MIILKHSHRTLLYTEHKSVSCATRQWDIPSFPSTPRMLAALDAVGSNGPEVSSPPLQT